MKSAVVRREIKGKTFFHPEDHAPLPFSYNRTLIVLLPRDPEWAYTYWDFSAETWNWIQSFLSHDKKAFSVLRIHNLDQNRHYDLQIDLEAKSWYLELGAPDHSFEVELGIIDADGKFHTIVRSNRIRTPRKDPSGKIDPAWVSEDFDEMLRLSGGPGSGLSSASFFSSSVRKKSS